jgi:hypothetical protein
MEIPNFITHYSRSEPFRSITNVSQDRRIEIISNFNETNAWGINRFQDPEYLEKRFVIEKQMRDEFVTKGGKPELEHPIYFFLGRNDQFEKHNLNRGHKIFLKDVALDSVSFTYGDSMLAFDQAYRLQSGELYKNQLCGKIFLFHEIEELFSLNNFTGKNPLSIEAHLWAKP